MKLALHNTEYCVITITKKFTVRLYITNTFYSEAEKERNVHCLDSGLFKHEEILHFYFDSIGFHLYLRGTLKHKSRIC